MSSVVQLTNDARQTFTTRLSGRTLRLSAWWQPSDEHWYLSVSGIVSGVRLVEEGLPLAGITPGIDGQLYIVGLGKPDRTAWGQTHQLVYIPNEELGL